MTRKVMAAGLLTVSLAVLAGCGGAKNAGDSSQPKLAAETSQTGQTQTGQTQTGQTQTGQTQTGQTQTGQTQTGQTQTGQTQTGQTQTGQTQTGQTQPAKGGTQYQIVGAESTAWYTVHEKFLDKDLSGTAVGKSSGITGALVIDGGKLQPSTVTVDLKKLQSDKAQRDKRLQTQGLEIAKYPTAEFAITGAEGPAPTFADGQEVAFKLAGKLKLHGTEKPVVWDARGKLQGGAFHLTGLIKFKLGEFNMEPPNVLNLISVDDNVQLDVDLTAKQG